MPVLDPATMVTMMTVHQLREYIEQTKELLSKTKPNEQLIKEADHLLDLNHALIRETDKFLEKLKNADLDHPTDDLVSDACACCGVSLAFAPPLCEDCAPSYTEYSDGQAFCDKHEPDEEGEHDG